MTNRGNKGYIPWHERIDEELVKEIMRDFVMKMHKAGIKLDRLNVDWNGGYFTAQPEGSAVGESDPPVH